jgi:transcriptional regulator with XRE-family HTH domain
VSHIFDIEETTRYARVAREYAALIFVYESNIMAIASASASEILSANLIVARAKAGLTQAQLADASGVARQTISGLERGTANISVTNLERIANALDIPIDRLFTPPFTGVVDGAEIARRRALPRTEYIGARQLHAAIKESTAGDNTAGARRTVHR